MMKKSNKIQTIKSILSAIGIILTITIVITIGVQFVSNIFVRGNVRATKAELQEAETLVKSMYPTLIINDKDKEVKSYRSNSYPGLKVHGKYESYDESNYYATYTFWGTMDTPEGKNDKVIIFMSKSEYNPYYDMNDNSEWSMSIFQNNPDGKRWDYSFNEVN